MKKDEILELLTSHREEMAEFGVKSSIKHGVINDESKQDRSYMHCR